MGLKFFCKMKLIVNFLNKYELKISLLKKYRALKILFSNSKVGGLSRLVCQINLRNGYILYLARYIYRSEN